MDTFNTPAKAGTIGGTIFVFLINILTGDIIRTMLLAAAWLVVAACGVLATFLLLLTLSALSRPRRRDVSRPPNNR